MTVAYELGPKAYTRLIRIKITRVLRAPNKLKCRLSCTHHQSMQLLTLIFLSLASVPPPQIRTSPHASRCRRPLCAACPRLLMVGVGAVPALPSPHPHSWGTHTRSGVQVVSAGLSALGLCFCPSGGGGGVNIFAAPTLHAAPLLCLVFCLLDMLHEEPAASRAAPKHLEVSSGRKGALGNDAAAGQSQPPRTHSCGNRHHVCR